MTAFTILLVAAALVLALYIAYRLVDRVFIREEQPVLAGAEEHLARLDTLAERRARIQRELKDIELDHDMGKLDDDDFRRLQRRYQRRWLEVDRELESIAGLDDETLANVDEELERRLAARSIGRRRTVRRDRRVCPDCAEANPIDAATCRGCGHALDGERESRPSPNSLASTTT